LAKKLIGISQGISFTDTMHKMSIKVLLKANWVTKIPELKNLRKNGLFANSMTFFFI
jgi:hypothetical protein